MQQNGPLHHADFQQSGGRRDAGRRDAGRRDAGRRDASRIKGINSTSRKYAPCWNFYRHKEMGLRLDIAMLRAIKLFPQLQLALKTLAFNRGKKIIDVVRNILV